MKKISVLIALAICFGLAVYVLEAPAPATAEADPFNQNMVIAHLPKSVGGAWYTRKFQGFGRYSGITGSQTFQMGPSAGDAAQQNRFIQDVIAQGVDAICISPFAPEQTDHMLGMAMEAGIIVISTEGEGMQNKHYNIEAFDFDAFGSRAADLLAEGIGGEGEILIFVGSLASSAHVGWASAIVAAVNERHPGITIANPGGVFIETGNNAALSYERAREALMAHPNVRGAFCPSATDTPSIARAIEEAGLIEQITYVAVGLPNATRTFIQSGAIDVLMSWDPAEKGLVMCRLAGAVRAGIQIQDGDDLGVFGFNRVTVNGNNIRGTEWRLITAENVANFNY